MPYQIEKEKCVTCGYCKFLCFFGAVKKNDDEDFYSIDESVCHGCGLCADGCINRAIFPTANHQPIKHVFIDKEKCIGCSLCSRNCPVGAISGVIKQPFTIDEEKCIHCGLCAEKCRKDAITVEK